MSCKVPSRGRGGSEKIGGGGGGREGGSPPISSLTFSHSSSPSPVNTCCAGYSMFFHYFIFSVPTGLVDDGVTK